MFQKDIMIEILMLLNYRDILNFSKICKDAYHIASNDVLWRKKLNKDFPLRSIYIYYPQYLNMNPRELYQTIMQKSKIIEVDLDDIAKIIGDDTYTFITTLEKINEAFPKEKHPVLRGDVLHFSCVGNFRNEGKVLWDGEKIVLLDYITSNGGAVPKDFSFPEFPLDHFYDSIVHNTLIHISDQCLKQVEKNYNEKSKITHISDFYDNYQIYINGYKRFGKIKYQIEKNSTFFSCCKFMLRRDFYIDEEPDV